MPVVAGIRHPNVAIWSRKTTRFRSESWAEAAEGGFDLRLNCELTALGSSQPFENGGQVGGVDGLELRVVGGQVQHGARDLVLGFGRKPADGLDRLVQKFAHDVESQGFGTVDVFIAVRWHVFYFYGRRSARNKTGKALSPVRNGGHVTFALASQGIAQSMCGRSGRTSGAVSRAAASSACPVRRSSAMSAAPAAHQTGIVPNLDLAW